MEGGREGGRGGGREGGREGEREREKLIVTKAVFISKSLLKHGYGGSVTCQQPAVSPCAAQLT